MAQIRVLNENTVQELLTLPMALQAVEQAYLQKASGQGEIWPMVFHEFDPGHADFSPGSGDRRRSIEPSRKVEEGDIS